MKIGTLGTMDVTPQFNIDVSKKTTVAYITDYQAQYLMGRMMEEIGIMGRMKIPKVPPEARRGIVRLHNGDKWNERVGKREAERKLVQHFLVILNNMVKECYNKYYSFRSDNYELYRGIQKRKYRSEEKQ